MKLSEKAAKLLPQLTMAYSPASKAYHIRHPVTRAFLCARSDISQYLYQDVPLVTTERFCTLCGRALHRIQQIAEEYEAK